MKNTIGYCMTGSFCTFSYAIEQIEKLIKANYNIVPIMSYNASSLDTRFGKASGFINEIEYITGNKVLTSIEEVEPVGPEKRFDLVVVSPCSGNTLGKLANGIYDTPVTMCVKSHLRNQRPVLIGVSTNDALSSSAKNIGKLFNYKHYYFIPMSQDNYVKKPYSLVAHFEDTVKAVECALNEKQIQPMFKERKPI